MLIYLDAVGVQLDCFLCAIIFGIKGQTISIHAALERKAGKKWACLLCAFLSWLVQHDHCQDQLDGIPMGTTNLFRAFCGLTILFLLLFYPVFYLLNIGITELAFFIQWFILQVATVR